MIANQRDNLTALWRKKTQNGSWLSNTCRYLAPKSECKFVSKVMTQSPVEFAHWSCFLPLLDDIRAGCSLILIFEHTGSDRNALWICHSFSWPSTLVLTENSEWIDWHKIFIVIRVAFMVQIEIIWMVLIDCDGICHRHPKPLNDKFEGVWCLNHQQFQQSFGHLQSKWFPPPLVVYFLFSTTKSMFAVWVSLLNISMLSLQNSKNS